MVARQRQSSEMARSVPSDTMSDAGPDHPSRRERIRSMTAQLKSSPARLLARFDPSHHRDKMMDANDSDVPGITDNKAFNTGLVFEEEHPMDDMGQKSKNFLQKGLHFIAHPQQATKQTAADQIPDDPPFLTTEANSEFLRANDELDHALEVQEQARVEGTSNEYLDQEVEEIEDKVAYLEEEREDMKTAWITSRHVRRVRVVPQDYLEWPSLGDCQEIGENGILVTRWDVYGLKVLEYYMQNPIAPFVEPHTDMSFQTETLLHIAERIFVISEPLQVAAMEARDIYLYKDPVWTLKCLCGYLFLVKTGYVMTSMFIGILALVLMSKYAPNHVQRLRESHKRSSVQGERVMKIGEMFDQQGGQGWIEPVKEEFGPLLQQQASDLADFLEVLQNFYYWQNERATWISLSLFASLAMLAAFASAEYSLKVMWFGIGVYFFGTRPLASLVPRYRRVVGICKLGFWDVPNTAEVAFQRLQEKAQEVRARLLEEAESGALNNDVVKVQMTPRDSGISTNTVQHRATLITADGTVITEPQDLATLTTADGTVITERQNPTLLTDTIHIPTTNPSSTHAADTDRDILSFRGRYAGVMGRLIVSISGVRFIRSVDQVVLFTHPYTSLTEMRKATSTGPVGKMLPAAMPNEGISLIWIDESKTIVEGMRKRDEAFNTIIGFSGVRFMQLHPCEEGVQPNGDETIKGKRGWRPWRTQEGHE